MPNIKPLRKLFTKAREVREHHRERHTPSGFEFALADSIDYLDQQHWDRVTAHSSLFLSPRYLRVLEEAGPENLRQCYALIFKEKEPVAAIAAQSVTVSVARLRRKPHQMAGSMNLLSFTPISNRTRDRTRLQATLTGAHSTGAQGTSRRPP